MTHGQRARRRAGCKAGFTLPEVLTVAVVFAIIVVSVSTIYMAALRAYRRGEPANSAERKASWAIARMMPDFQQAIAVIPAAPPNEATAVAVRVPDKVWNAADQIHYNHVALTGGGDLYLLPGDFVYYYRGNDAGAMDAAGANLWRAVTHADGSAGKQILIADNLIDNPAQGGSPKPMFIYWPDVVRLRSVEITVTVRERAGAEVADSTMVSEVCLRNH
jgi:prepilin-type N-terminal cleavage/methylation domain-containing protein